jgi:hypothetical protein
MGLNLPKKTYQHEHGPHLEAILRKMCECVGAEYEKMTFADHEREWYDKYSWTEEESEKFTTWMTDYLYTNSKARRELMRLSHKNKKNCRKAASTFVSWYGWKNA